MKKTKISVFIRAHPWLKKSFNKSNKFRGAVYLTVNRNKPHFIRVLIRENQFNPSNPCPEKGTRIKRIRPMGTDFSTGSPAECRKREGKGVYSPSFIELSLPHIFYWTRGIKLNCQ
jgi:hypothetical protein